MAFAKLLAHFVFVIALVDGVGRALEKDTDVTKESRKAIDGVIARSAENIRETVEVDG